MLLLLGADLLEDPIELSGGHGLGCLETVTSLAFLVLLEEQLAVRGNACLGWSLQAVANAASMPVWIGGELLAPQLVMHLLVRVLLDHVCNA